MCYFCLRCAIHFVFVECFCLSFCFFMFIHTQPVGLLVSFQLYFPGGCHVGSSFFLFFLCFLSFFCFFLRVIIPCLFLGVRTTWGRIVQSKRSRSSCVTCAPHASLALPMRHLVRFVSIIIIIILIYNLPLLLLLSAIFLRFVFVSCDIFLSFRVDKFDFLLDDVSLIIFL